MRYGGYLKYSQGTRWLPACRTNRQYNHHMITPTGQQHQYVMMPSGGRGIQKRVAHIST